MTELSAWLRCALAVLAAWRATHLLAAEDGPGNILARLRRALGNSWAAGLMDCFYCLSLWIAAPLAFCITTRATDFVLVWLAISGGACLLERAAAPPVVVERLEGVSHGMLRKESREGPAHSLHD